MALEIHLKPVETLIFRSDVAAIGKFRCPSDHPLFPDSGPSGNHAIVFPRTSTEIQHAGGPRFVAGPNTISVYNSIRRTHGGGSVGWTRPTGTRSPTMCCSMRCAPGTRA